MARSVRILLVAILVVSMVVIGVVPAAAAGITWYVDGALGFDSGTCGTAVGADACKTIQYAITSRATAGDTVNVAAGTYAETVVVGKAITLVGAGKDLTIIRPTALYPTTVGHKYDANMQVVMFVNQTAGVTVSDMTIDGNQLGASAVVFWNGSSGTLARVRILRPAAFTGAQTAQGLAVDASTGHDTTLAVLDSDFELWNKNAIDVVTGNGATSGGGNITLTVADSTFVGAGVQSTIAQNGIVLWERGGGSINASITNSSFSEIVYSPDTDESAAILVYGSANGTLSSVTGCTFSNTELYISLAAGSLHSVMATGNTFDGVVGDTASLAQLLAIEQKMSHAPDEAGVGLIRVKANSVYVTAGASIQRAINAAVAGDTVNVAAGTYVEQLSINKDLSLVGTGAPVVLSPATRTTYSIAESGSVWEPVIVAFGGTLGGANAISGAGQANVSISGIVVDGANVAPGSGHRGAGILLRNVIGGVSGSTVRNMSFDGQETFGITAYGHSDLVITDNTVSGYSRGGIGVNGNHGVTPIVALVTGNTVTGPGLGIASTWASNGIQVGWGATGIVSGNTVTGNGWVGDAWAGTGILIAASDSVVVENNTVTANETGIGVAGDSWFGTGATADNVVVRNNTVDQNEYGISVQDRSAGTQILNNTVTNSRYDGVGLSSYYSVPPTGTVINYNRITGNNTEADDTSGGLWVDDTVAGMVDAKFNWWGSPSGPKHSTANPNGQGNAVIGDADFSPWMDQSLNTMYYLVGALVVEAPATAYVGQEFAVDVKVSGVTGLAGYDLDLTYDATRLDVMSITPHSTFDWSSGYKTPDSGWSNGAIHWEVTMSQGGSTGNGDVTLMRVTFKAKATGDASVLPAANPLLTDAEGDVLVPVSASGGHISIAVMPHVTGTVMLQGRAGNPPKYGGAVVAVGAVASPETPASGAYDIVVAPSTTAYAITMEHDSYLDTSSTVVVTAAGLNVPTQFLLFGDINDDDSINIQDLAFIAYRFGSTTTNGLHYDARADMNLDNAISIYDLTGAAGNYGEFSSPWRTN
ncbi:MAG: right-handed parallel beta-helix repeat-containing protein [Anaerolineae bacterium]